MELRKPKPKCAGCGYWKVEVKCSFIYLDGCDNYYCWNCWIDHGKKIDARGYHT